MGLIRYQCSKCRKEKLVFSGEEKERLFLNHVCEDPLFLALPPNPAIVHATNSFMTELMLDAVWTIHDLDRQLNFEVSDEKELKVYNDFRVSY